MTAGCVIAIINLRESSFALIRCNISQIYTAAYMEDRTDKKAKISANNENDIAALPDDINNLRLFSYFTRSFSLFIFTEYKVPENASFSDF